MKDKLKLLLLFLLVSSVSVKAQTAANILPDHSAGKKDKGKPVNINSTIWAGYTIVNQPSLVYGATISYMITHNLNIGICITGFENKFNANIRDWKTSNSLSYLRGCYGGTILEPFILPKSKVHFSFPVIIGVGTIVGNYVYQWFSERDPPYEHSGHEKNTCSFFVFEPGLQVEFSLLKRWCMGIGAKYRLTSDLNFTTLSIIYSKKILRYPTINIFMKFGNFRKNIKHQK